MILMVRGAFDLTFVTSLHLVKEGGSRRGREGGGGGYSCMCLSVTKAESLICNYVIKV